MSCVSLISAGHLSSQEQSENDELGGVHPQLTFPSAATDPSTSLASPLHWRPPYLRKRVLFGFLVLFALILAAVETLLYISIKDTGIATSEPSKHYLWTNGPTAFLTVVAALWTRVEYQSNLIAPWTRLSRSDAPASRSLRLDYVSQSPFVNIFTSIRNRDFLVTITTTIGLVIKIIIVVSTGLIALTWIGVAGSYPMVIQDQVINSAAQMHFDNEDLAWYIMQEPEARDTSLSDGLSGGYAFQSVQTNLPSSVETRVTVEGFTNSLHCEVVNITLADAIVDDTNKRGNFNLTIDSPNCTVPQLMLEGVRRDNRTELGDGDTMITKFARMTSIRCHGQFTDAGRRIFVIFGEMSYPGNWSQVRGPSRGTLKKSTQLFCVPHYTIRDFEIVHNGTQSRATATLLQDSTTKALEFLNAWNIAELYFEMSDDAMSIYQFPDHPPINVSSSLVDANTYSATLLKTQVGPDSEVTSLYDPSILQQVTANYYSQFCAIIAKRLFMHPQPVNTTGLAIVNQNRLVVQPWAAQWMAGLVIFCIVLNTISLFLGPERNVLPSNPSSIMGMASVVIHSGDILRLLRCDGLADAKYQNQNPKATTFRSRIAHNPRTGQNRFCVMSTASDSNMEPGRVRQANSDPSLPYLLRPACRTILCVGLVLPIIALELMLQESNRKGGIGDARDDSYLHYTWTAIPSIIFGLLSIALSSTDSCVRTLAPYVLLTKAVHRENMPLVGLLDASVPRILYKEIRLRSIGLFATTMSFLIASVFTTFSGSLFQVLSMPITAPMALQAYKTFNLTFDGNFNKTNFYDNLHKIALDGNLDEMTPASTMASAILAGNFTYPRFTYDNLAFPELSSTAPLAAGLYLNTSSAAISATIPSLRGRLSCRSYDFAEMKINITTNNRVSNPIALFIRIDGEECFSQFPGGIGQNFWMGLYEKTTYFGFGGHSRDRLDHSVSGCSDLLYAWGRLDYQSDPIVQHASALGCNMTYEIVDVDLTFTGSGLDLDKQTPPRPRESTARHEISASFDLSFSYRSLTYISYDTNKLGTDRFFALLVSSPWAIPVTDLGDPSASDRVAAAIHKQHGIIMAQSLAQRRVPATETNHMLVTSRYIDSKGDHGYNASFEPLRDYNATATDETSRRRVVQDPKATRILEGLLGATLVFAMAGWAALPRPTELPPRQPLSIASVAALLAGGDLLQRMPHDAQERPLSEKEMVAKLNGGPEMRVWMGWKRKRQGESETGAHEFGIHVEDKDGEDTMDDATDSSVAQSYEMIHYPIQR